MDETAASLLVKIQADTASLKAGMAEAGESGRAAASAIGEAFDELQTRLLGFLAVTKVFTFFKEGVDDLGKFEQSMQTLEFQINNTGQAYDGMDTELKSYLLTEAEHTRFNKGELAQSLDTIILKTQDLNMSLYLQSVAEDLAVAAGISVVEASDQVARAYEGQTFGLRSIARELGINNSQGKDLEVVWDTMISRTHGLAQGEDNLATSAHQLAVQWAELKEAGGGLFENAIKGWVFGLDELKTGFNWFFETGKELKSQQAEKDAIFIHEWEAKEKARLQSIQHIDDLKKEKVEEDALLRSVETELKLDDQLVKDVEEQSRAYRAKEVATRKAIEEDQHLDEEITKLMDKQTRKALESAHIIDSAFQSTFNSLFSNLKKGEKNWQEFGKSAVRFAVDAMGEIIIKQGEADFAMSGFDLLSPTTWALAAGDAAKAAGEMGLGQGLKSFASAYLATGGIVTRPTNAIIGEAGPEAVIPLNQGGAQFAAQMAGSVGGPGEMHFHFHGQATQQEAVRFGKSAAIQFAETQRDYQRRFGLLTPGS